jgi:ABC-type multidrug transport system, ATPase and permease components
MEDGSVEYTPKQSLQSGIHFNKISFSYPNNEKFFLKEVDLFLPRGTTLALVGASGSGKSTLADLLPRFYDPTEGQISIDGRDLREFELKSLRKAMGIVSQDTFLFNASVRENIAYANPDADDEQIVEAAKGANAYEFIEVAGGVEYSNWRSRPDIIGRAASENFNC